MNGGGQYKTRFFFHLTQDISVDHVPSGECQDDSILVTRRPWPWGLFIYLQSGRLSLQAKGLKSLIPVHLNQVLKLI